MKVSHGENRALHRVMIEINTSLAAVHRGLSLKISSDRYAAATDYVAQFIPYTTIWNIKFTYNMESPEVALMQIMHLDYIIEHETEHDLIREKKELQQMKQLFKAYSPYSDSLIEIRRNQFLQYIDNASH